MRLPALIAIGFLTFSHTAAASGAGPAYYEALMGYCYKGDLSERIGRDPDSRSYVGAASKRAALGDLREAMTQGEKAVTALCASGYYQAIQAGYVTVIRRSASN